MNKLNQEETIKLAMWVKANIETIKEFKTWQDAANAANKELKFPITSFNLSKVAKLCGVNLHSNNPNDLLQKMQIWK